MRLLSALLLSLAAPVLAGFSSQSAVPSPYSRHCFTIFLEYPLQAADALADKLLAVSSPSSPLYGSFYQDTQDLKKYLETVHGDLHQNREDVLNWLKNDLSPLHLVELDAHERNEKIKEKKGISSSSSSSVQAIHSNNYYEFAPSSLSDASSSSSSVGRVHLMGDAIDICSPVHKIENLFQTKMNYHVWNNGPSSKSSSSSSSSSSAHRVLRAQTPLTYPENVKGKISFVGGVDSPIHSHHLRREHHRQIVQNTNLLDPKAVQKTFSSAAAPPRPTPPSGTVASEPPLQEDCAGRIHGIRRPHLLNITGGNGEIALVWSVDPAFTPSSSDSVSDSSPSSSLSISQFIITLTDIFGREQNIQLDGKICHGSTCSTTIFTRNYEGYHVKVTANYYRPKEEEQDAVKAKQSHVIAAILPVDSCSSNLVFAGDFATPDFLRELYSIPRGLRATHPNNSQSVVEFSGQYFNPPDVTTFLDYMGQPRAIVDEVFGPNDPNEGKVTGGEAQLDIQVMMGLSPGARTIFWSVEGKDQDNKEEPFLKWLSQLNDHPNPPLVTSVSYGDLEAGLPESYTNRLNLEFIKAGLRGLTIVVASGDQGISTELEAGQTVADMCKRTRPEFPTSSPYVLSVGATQLSNRMADAVWRGVLVGQAIPREVVCAAETGGIITSGGGFSDRFAQPDWQKTEVSNYLNKSGAKYPELSKFSASGRGYPDVTAYGTKFPILMDGVIVPTAGTSASTPVISSLLSLLNDVRLSQNQSVLGFVVPLLYEIHRDHPEAFNDVVYGSNKCLLRDQDCCSAGFSAVPGWDAVSGLGSINYNKMAELLGKQYPGKVLTPAHQSSYVDRALFGSSSQSSLNLPTLISILVSVCSLGLSVYLYSQLRILKEHESVPSSSSSFASKLFYNSRNAERSPLLA